MQELQKKQYIRTLFHRAKCINICRRITSSTLLLRALLSSDNLTFYALWLAYILFFYPSLTPIRAVLCMLPYCLPYYSSINLVKKSHKNKKNPNKNTSKPKPIENYCVFLVELDRVYWNHNCCWAFPNWALTNGHFDSYGQKPFALY